MGSFGLWLGGVGFSGWGRGKGVMIRVAGREWELVVFCCGRVGDVFGGGVVLL